jgi:hypothetical protein
MNKLFNKKLIEITNHNFDAYFCLLANVSATNIGNTKVASE